MPDWSIAFSILRRSWWCWWYLRRRRVVKIRTRLQRFQPLQFLFRTRPLLAVLLGVIRSIQVGIKGQDVASQLGGRGREIILGQVIQQLGVGFVGQRILSRCGVLAGVAIGVWQGEVAVAGLVQQLVIVV